MTSHLRVTKTTKVITTWAEGLMRCCRRSTWFYHSTCLPQFLPPVFPGCPGPPQNPPFQLQLFHKNSYTYMPPKVALACPLNIPLISLVRSSLNCAFADSKSKSDSNCKVVGLEVFTRSWPLLLFLDLRLAA